MPALGRNPTTNTLGIQFGLPSRPAMSTHSGNSSSRGQCHECVRKREAGHRSARDPKFCPRHQCDIVDASGEMCTMRKKAAEARCSTHMECKASTCHRPRILDESGIPNEYCTRHTCVVMGCNEGMVYEPSQGAHDGLCATHVMKVCMTPSCAEWKLGHGNYCMQHTCILSTCDKESISDARPFCNTHNVCNVQGCSKPRCQFGSEFEAVCREHYIAPCAIESCRKKSSPSSRHCDLHSCLYTLCQKEARPGLGKAFCIDHKCTDQDCQLLKSFSEVDGSLRINSFCLYHECKSKGCAKHVIPDKPYCNSHCCTKHGCTESRDGHKTFGTLCPTHYEEKIRENAAADVLEQLRLNKERAQREATARADEARRQARRQEEELQERERRKQAADAERRQRRPAPSSSDRQYPGNEEHRYHEDFDEGYRSHRSSGERFPVDDQGW